MHENECDVAIIGCGPTGVVLANLLGGLGVRVVVLERDADVYPVPRATHIDEETVRNFQATGLIDALLPHTIAFGRVEMVAADGRVLLDDTVSDPATPHGYAGSRFFDQPAFERILREGLARYANVRLVTGVDVTAVTDDGAGVTVRAAGADEDVTVRAAWAVGCDGGRSITRELLGAEMEMIAPRRPWLIADALLRDPADAALLPGGFRYVLGRERLTIYAHGIGLNRRWEFQLGPDEEVPSRETVVAWIAEFVDPERLEITRVVPYAHTSLLAKSWREGRVLIAGDAAHMMPPSAGQGMCSGIRDAVNLAWKLGEVVAGRASDRLLDTYERERSPHVREILEGAVFISQGLSADTPLQRLGRSAKLALARNVPVVRRVIRRLAIRRPPLRNGFLDSESRDAGRFAPQIEVVCDGRRRRLDDVVGYGFALLATQDALSAEALAWAGARGIRLLRSGVEDEGEALAHWLGDARIDFAVVRPDRQIFSAGRAEDFDRARAAFDQWSRI